LLLGKRVRAFEDEGLGGDQLANGVAEVITQADRRRRVRLGDLPLQGYGSIEDAPHSSRASRIISTAHSTTPNRSWISRRTVSARSWMRRRSSGSVTRLPSDTRRKTS